MEFKKNIQETWKEVKRTMEMRREMHVSPFVLSEQAYLTKEEWEEVRRKIDEL